MKRQKNEVNPELIRLRHCSIVALEIWETRKESERERRWLDGEKILIGGRKENREDFLALFLFQLWVGQNEKENTNTTARQSWM